jgi:1,4-alpha-glucan branching enzyme
LNAEKYNTESPLKKNGNSGIKKQYLKSGPMCNVTFRLPKDAAPDARSITIVGDFNNWNKSETPLKRLKNGDFKLTLKLPCNREYRFRYLIDANRWENDWFADKYISNPHGSDDSLVIV